MTIEASSIYAPSHSSSRLTRTTSLWYSTRSKSRRQHQPGGVAPDGRTRVGRRRKGAVQMKRSLVILCVVAGMTAALCVASAATGSSPVQRPECDDNSPLCAEVYDSVGYAGAYTGHDEPALLFYSNATGSGSSMDYRMTLPTEPPTAPSQDG